MTVSSYIDRTQELCEMGADMDISQIFQAERQKVSLRFWSMHWRKKENKSKTKYLIVSLDAYISKENSLFYSRELNRQLPNFKLSLPEH